MKINFGAAVADARGKFAGNVFSKSRFGAYIRRKSSPTQPRSTKQNSVRSSFSQFAKRWGSTLTEIQRAAWRSLAAAHPVTNVFGNSVILTGLQLYVQVNQNLAQVGVALIDDAPITLSVGAPGALTAHTFGVAAGISVDPTTDAAAGEHYELLCGPPQSAGRQFIGSGMRILKTAAGGAGPYTLSTALYEARFGTVVEDMLVPVGLVYVDDTTGAKSARSIALITLTA